MSDSNWRRNYTIGLVVAAVGAVSFAVWLWRSTDALQSRIEQHTASASETYSDPRYIAIEGECLAVPEPERDKCLTKEREAAYEGQRNESDLEAQRIMAAWTRTIGIATIVGMTFGIFGLSLIFVTFRETRRAADAGFEANEIARTSSERQLRPYIGLESGGLEYSAFGAWPTVRVFLKNFGQTPAYDFRAGINVVVRPQGHRIATNGPDESIATSELAPTQGFMLVSEQSEPEAGRMDENPDARLYAVISCEYKDTFGKRHDFNLCLVQSGRDGLQPHPIEETPTNDDTRHHESD
jgi:hypothetical protein